MHGETPHESKTPGPRPRVRFYRRGRSCQRQARLARGAQACDNHAMDFMDWIRHPASDFNIVLFVALAAAAVIVMGVGKGGFGGGAGSLSVPLMMQTGVPARSVLGAWLPILLVCDIFTLRSYPRQWSRRAVALLVPGALGGIAIGLAVLDSFKGREHWLRITIGAMALVFAAFFALRGRLEKRLEEEPAWRPGWLAGTAAGLVAGAATVLCHSAGPVTTVYLLPQKLDKQSFVGTTARFYVMLNLVKVPLFLWQGIIDEPTLKFSAWMWVLCPPGVWLGSWLNRRISPSGFVRVIYVLLAIAGGKLVFDGLRAALTGG